MQLTREEIIKNSYKVLIQDGPKLRIVKFPELVDTDTSTVSMWTIPLEDIDITKKDTITNDLMKSPPPEIDSYAVLKETKGKIFVLDSQDKLVIESKFSV